MAFLLEKDQPAGSSSSMNSQGSDSPHPDSGLEVFGTEIRICFSTFFFAGNMILVLVPLEDGSVQKSASIEDCAGFPF